MTVEQTAELLEILGVELAIPTDEMTRWIKAEFPHWVDAEDFLRIIPVAYSRVTTGSFEWCYLWKYERIATSQLELKDGLLGIGSLPDGSWLIVDTHSEVPFEIGSIGLYDFVIAEQKGFVMGRSLFGSFKMTYGEWLKYGMEHPDSGVEFI